MAANVRRNADKYARSWYAPVFGARGSQVQILPSDQHHTKGADKSHLPANIDHLEPRRVHKLVHKLVHKRVLRMVTISQDAKGNFTARKRLPDDVREEYARRHGQRFEAKFFAAASTGAAEAKRLFREWETEVTARIDANGLRGSTFKPRIRDAICGHSPRSVADEYEMPSLGDMAEALKKFPRYDI
jgi:hypothetical protein